MSGSDTVSGLIRMANQIATNMATMRFADEPAAVAEHIKRYWEPRMIAKIRVADQTLLTPLARQAIALLGETGASQAQAT
ncbi:MAG TPA: formate dehydrogenase subunit delta [Sphingobium sp.]|nr:formate dehydrogenase subunit delta [Sphingobium sp.]